MSGQRGSKPDEELDDEIEVETNENEEEGQDGAEEDEGDVQDEVEGDEGESEDDDDSAPALPEKPAKELSRGEARVKAAVDRAKAAEEKAAKADRLEREIEDLKRRIEQPQQRQETAQERADRLALLSPEERFTLELNDMKAELARNQRIQAFQTYETQDKANFDAKALVNPRYAKYQAEVEARLAAERKAGNNWPRETILKFVLGERVLENKKQVSKQRVQGQQNIRRQATKPTNTRGERGNSKEPLDEKAARKARLEADDVYI